MTKPIDYIGKTWEFFRLLRLNPRALYLLVETIITGGLSWRIRAWQAEKKVAQITSGMFEAKGDEYRSAYRDWQDVEEQARFGMTLSKEGKINVQKMLDAGVSEPQIRTWVVNGHMNRDGIIKYRHYNVENKTVFLLGWIWHGLVVVSAFLFVVYAWVLPGPIWKKSVVTLIVVVFFSLMGILMNATSISALPPQKNS